MQEKVRRLKIAARSYLLIYLCNIGLRNPKHAMLECQLNDIV